MNAEPTESTTSMRTQVIASLQAMRPHQWVKNGFVLAPLVFTGAVICCALPLTDTALVIVRRKLAGKPIFDYAGRRDA